MKRNRMGEAHPEPIPCNRATPSDCAVGRHWLPRPSSARLSPRKFPLESRRRLPLEDYIRLRMVEAFRALYAEEVDQAIETLDFVLRTEAVSTDEQLADARSFLERTGTQEEGRIRAGIQRNLCCARAGAEVSRRCGVYGSHPDSRELAAISEGLEERGPAVAHPRRGNSQRYGPLSRSRQHRVGARPHCAPLRRICQERWSISIARSLYILREIQIIGISPGHW